MLYSCTIEKLRSENTIGLIATAVHGKYINYVGVTGQGRATAEIVKLNACSQPEIPLIKLTEKHVIIEVWHAVYARALE